MLSAALLAVFVAFPAEGAKLPYLKECYMIGAVPRGVTNLVVQGRPVEIYRTGAWVTMVDLVEGTNTVEISANGEKTNRCFSAAFNPRPVKFTGSVQTAPAKEKPYEKLPYAADVPAEHPACRARGEMLVCIDPGHGGSDTGTLSPHGFPEKDANLRVAREVRKALEEKGYRVEMTRDSDVALDLYERPRKAHESKADAFVSIHHNAPGFGSDPRNVRYHTVYSWNALGEGLAADINARMAETLDGDIPNKGPLHANYAVTRSPEIPSCLVEVDFITTPRGEEDAWSNPRRKAIGRAIADGIEDWLSKEDP